MMFPHRNFESKCDLLHLPTRCDPRKGCRNQLERRFSEFSIFTGLPLSAGLTFMNQLYTMLPSTWRLLAGITSFHTVFPPPPSFFSLAFFFVC